MLVQSQPTTQEAKAGRQYDLCVESDQGRTLFKANSRPRARRFPPDRTRLARTRVLPGAYRVFAPVLTVWALLLQELHNTAMCQWANEDRPEMGPFNVIV